MNKWRILSLDPSGDFSSRGKGHTGVVFLEYDKENKTILKVIPKTIKASKYKSKQDYYKSILKVIKTIEHDFLVVEDYRAMMRNATTETSELIGVIEFNYPKLFKQKNTTIKNVRYSNVNLLNRKILSKKGRDYIINNRRLDGHGRDALRHALAFICDHTMHALKEMETLWQKKQQKNQ